MDLSTGSSSTTRYLGGLRKCNCGLPAKIFTSKTKKNPWKRLFGCQLYKDGGTEPRKYFKWFDDEESKRLSRNALSQAMAEIEEKEYIIHELRMTVIELRTGLEKHVEDAEKVIYRQRLIITGLSGLLVCAIGAIIFG
ncbi:uncharacterized protein At4g04775-like [Capsella rubella]|uniref:uncharacterized protein At4g04775-like n=1 Tax=Capsella rubella TaxID=81985 RepID=UPI000CD4AAFA|nr:uncharacterized protein At4g04775-like [Capsella rubella]